MHLGFIGTGRIASAMVEGLQATSHPRERIYLSPRGRETSARLAATYPRVEVAADNQAVVDAADVVVLCVRPEVVVDALRGLRFGSRHLLVSLVAMTPLDEVRLLSTPATVVRAVPIPSVRLRQSPTAIFPGEPRVQALFDRLGTALPVEDEATFNVVAAATSLIKPTYLLLGEVWRWMVEHGVPPTTATRFLLGQFRSTLEMAAELGEERLGALGEEAATPGGLNEQAARFLRDAGAMEAFPAALEAVLARASPWSR